MISYRVSNTENTKILEPKWVNYIRTLVVVLSSKQIS